MSDRNISEDTWLNSYIGLIVVLGIPITRSSTDSLSKLLNRYICGAKGISGRYVFLKISYMTFIQKIIQIKDYIASIRKQTTITLRSIIQV